MVANCWDDDVWKYHINITAHNEERFNGIYTYSNHWNGQPHFVTTTGFHLFYFVTDEYGQQSGWNIDENDQNHLEHPGSEDWHSGGWFRPKQDDVIDIVWDANGAILVESPDSINCPKKQKIKLANVVYCQI